jgi:cation diffusion facilitator CzcD-associated flavoprotein CzcO
MRVRRPQLNTDHSFLFEIIDDVRLIIQQYQLAPRIQLGWTVNGVCFQKPNERWCANCSQDPDIHSSTSVGTMNVTAGQLLLCINRRLGAPRCVEYEGEGDFEGLVMRGLSGDNEGTPWSGKRLVVLGHGPYAIEQVRTALEHEAAHAMLLVRRHGLVCPQIVDYLNLVR